jgi:hypothetical protein
MPSSRMNREEFFAKLVPLDAEQRGKILWNLYWRGTAAVRERIEGELDPPERERRRRDAAAPPDPALVLAEVSRFVELARSGAYIAGDRRVSRTERTRWRVTFRQLVTDAQLALHAEDTAPGERAMELMIDLARDAEGHFRSEDPLEAAKFVLSEAVSALWGTILAEHGFARFAERAVPQLIRWESAYGWSNGTGTGKVAEREIALADVLAPMLATSDMWTGFADAYLTELDRIAAAEPPTGRRPGRAVSAWDPGWRRSERTRDLAWWNELLSDHVDEERAERLADHPAFEGPDADFMRAKAARRRGDIVAARELIRTCLEQLPGSQEFAEFAEEVGAALPPRAIQIRAERAAAEALIAQAHRDGRVSWSLPEASSTPWASSRRPDPQRAGVAVSRPRLVTVSMWPAGTTAEYSAVQQEGQQYWRNTMGAST